MFDETLEDPKNVFGGLSISRFVINIITSNNPLVRP